jgi:Flp pilus assembly pilin Flp
MSVVLRTMRVFIVSAGRAGWDTSGVAIVEYAIIAATLALAMMTTIAAIGVQASTQLGTTQSNLTSASALNSSSLP